MSIGAIVLAAKLLLGGWLKRLGEGLNALGWFIRRNPWRAAALLFVALCVVFWLRGNHYSAKADAQGLAAKQAQGRFLAQRDEFHKLVDLFKKAREDARKADIANKKRYQRETSAAIERVQNEADKERERALAALRVRLRSGTDGSNGVQCSGDGRTARLPVLSVVPGGTLLPQRPAIVDERDAEICTINTVNLERLKDAWRKVSAVDVNGNP